MKLKPISRTIAAILVLAAVAFVGANIADYVRYTWVLARAKGLTQDQLRAMGDWCRKTPSPRDERRILKGKDIPAEFLPLNSKEVERYRDDIRIQLYQLRDISLSFVISTWEENQMISISLIDSDTPKWTPLWYRDPALYKAIYPDNRLITIRHNDRDWIVLSDRIVVVGDRVENNSQRYCILASASITATERALLEEIIRNIPEEARDDVYSCAGDGSESKESILYVIFTADGRRSPRDILAINAWVETLGPLLSEVSKLAPKGYPIEHKKMTAKFTADPQRYPVDVSTDRSGESHSSFCYPTRVPPWWCVWRSLANRNSPDY